MSSPHPILFRPLSQSDYNAVAQLLSRQQQLQLEAALNYHALLNPGAEISAVVAVGDPSQVPALTDSSTVAGSAINGAERVGGVRVRSSAVGEAAAVTAITRSLRLSHRDASPATTRPPEQFSIPRRIYRALEKRGPVILDDIREFLMKRRERAIEGALPRFPDGPYDDELQAAFAAHTRAVSPAPEGAAPAVIIGLHWLQTGGAERWAVESIQIAKDAGLLPVVVTDQNSVHPWIDRPELEGCVVITLSFDHHEHQIDVSFAHALLENFDVQGIVLHHSHYLYQMLPWLKQQRPSVHVVDSLHIVEYLGGGYPGTAVHFDEYIDKHHVISPQLVEWLGTDQGVEEHKLALAPLATLTASGGGKYAPRDPAKPFTVAFVGRLSRQKRPDVFLGLVKQLKRQGRPFRAILHGDGEMRNIVDGLIAQAKLEDVVEQRFEDVPVSQTLTESDVLVVTSINEGLTLTTFEAVAAGIPVISADVGSQRTIVQGAELLPRPARPFIRGAAALIAQYDANDTLRKGAWSAQQQRITEFSALPSAHHWMKEYFESWQA